MVVAPHPVTITVKDNAGVALADASVYIRNLTKKSNSAVETSTASGIVLIDLANLPLGDGQTLEYEAGDITMLIAYAKETIGEGHDAARYVVIGASKSQTLQLNPVGYEKDAHTRIVEIHGGNTSASTGYYFKVWAVADGELLAHVDVPKDDTKTIFFGAKGKDASLGFVVERENTALIVTATKR